MIKIATPSKVGEAASKKIRDFESSKEYYNNVI